MIATDELIQDLELELQELKNTSMLGKAAKAEACVNQALICIKQMHETQKQLTKGLVDLNKRLSEHVKTGK